MTQAAYLVRLRLNSGVSNTIRFGSRLALVRTSYAPRTAATAHVSVNSRSCCVAMDDYG